MKKDIREETVIGLRVISSRIAKKTGISNAITRRVLTAFIEVVGEMVRAGSFIIIKGLFSICIRQRKAKRTFVPSPTGPGHYTITPKRSHIRMRPCIPLIKGRTLHHGRGRSYIKEGDSACQKNRISRLK